MKSRTQRVGDLSGLCASFLTRARPPPSAALSSPPMDPREALRRIFGFEQFRPGQEEAVAAALADRDALVVMPTGSGKSLCYQLPALMRDDLTLVVSPLVSLMQDQVQALARVAPGRVELVNAQRGGALNAEAVARAARRRGAAAVRRPGAVRAAALSRGGVARARRPVRRRRGALRLAVGARLPAGLLRARRRGARARRARDDRADRDRDAAGGGRHRPPAGAARSGAGDDRLRPPQPQLRGRSVRDRGRQATAARGRAGRAGRAAGDRVRGHARRERGAGGRAARGARRGGAGLPRRPRSRRARRDAGALHVRRASG